MIITPRKKSKGSFKKNDERINKKGRPKNGTRANKLIQKFADELNLVKKTNKNAKVNKNKNQIVVVDTNDTRTPREVFIKQISVDELAKLVIEHAMLGDRDMIKLACEYVFGNPTQRIETDNKSFYPAGIEVAFIEAAEELKKEKELNNDRK